LDVMRPGVDRVSGRRRANRSSLLAQPARCSRCGSAQRAPHVLTKPPCWRKTQAFSARKKQPMSGSTYVDKLTVTDSLRARDLHDRADWVDRQMPAFIHTVKNAARRGAL